MCSILGGYWLNVPPPAGDVLECRFEFALSILQPRGPDQESLEQVNERCVLAGNRLLVRGTEDRGRLPYQSPGHTAFYNGEIYNFGRWDTAAECDGEVILPLFEELGPAMFPLLDGEFALCIWQETNQRLTLARDPFGTKPLYFSWDGQRLLWASTPTAIVALADPGDHPLCAAKRGPLHHRTRAPQEPYTSFRGIWTVPPGHYLQADRDGVQLVCYNSWGPDLDDRRDCVELFSAVEESMASRLCYDQGPVGIPMSAGVDSGIIAFSAEQLGVPYHLFSVVSLDGEETPETAGILQRVERLRGATDVTLLDCGEAEIQTALDEMYLPGYYDCERFDSGNITMHTVFHAMQEAGIRVALDGSGGDELFHGYTFRDEFTPVNGWPRPWTCPYYYSVFTTLLDYTAKTDRAGAFTSIESRFPFQTARLMNAALRLSPSDTLKWPLRRFLLERLDYGSALEFDRERKFGFYLHNQDASTVRKRMEHAWCAQHGLALLPSHPPEPFPFTVGGRCKQSVSSR